MNAVDDTLAGARGAAACLAQIATALADAAACEPPTPEALRRVAATLQASAQRATLACMSLAAHAGRLEAYAVVQAEDLATAQTYVETGANEDAGNYVRECDTEDPATYAAEAFIAWVHDEGVDMIAPLDLVAAEAVYVAAFLRAVG